MSAGAHTAGAARIYPDAIVVDMHNDMPSRVVDDGYDPDVRHAPGFGGDDGETDLPRLRESGITGQFLSVFVHARWARMRPDQSFARARAQVDAIHAFVARHPRDLLLATRAADVRRARELGRIAILIGIEGGHAIESSLDRLRELHRLGARYMTLTWNNGNAWAGSSIGEAGTRTGGLTDFGREVVREMNRLGMLVDLSHVSDETFDDALATSDAPVIASHSNARALTPSPRNLADDQLRAIAASGGVVGLNFYSGFVDAAFLAAQERIGRELEEQFAPRLAAVGSPDEEEELRRQMERRAHDLAVHVPAPPFSALLDHLDHMIRVAGIEHVGLGSDFDGVGGFLPTGMRDVTCLSALVDPLLERGYDGADVAKVLGGNVLRVMERVLDRAPAGPFVGTSEPRRE